MMRIGIPTGLFFGVLVGLLAGCAAARPRTEATTAAEAADFQRFEFSRPQMGVPFRISVYDRSETNAQAAATAAYDRVAALNAILSDYDPDSELSRLCRDTPPETPSTVSPELGFMLERSLELSQRSDGAFDATVGPLVNLWRRARRRLELPSENLLAEARSRTGWQRLRYDPRSRSVTFLAPRMRLDFGGIAKGYAADEALAVLRRFGVSRALVAAAGDIRVGDAPPGQPGWSIEVGALDTPGAPPPRTLRLVDAAVSTSGDLFQRLEIGGRRYSHIVDPRTGIGLTNQTLVTVVARDGTTADSLATAVDILGPERGLALVRRYLGARALILRPEGDRIVSYSSRDFP
ncbi:MAG: FAD:protein FMN transferase [Verrucomicrobiales bacterium]|nr:FAD:protein FMN transferase [Verrucomicrobiales bacterium]